MTGYLHGRAGGWPHLFNGNVSNSNVFDQKVKVASYYDVVNFARKVIATQECDFLVLDEILGLLDKHIATVDMVTELLKQKDESMHIILTGNRVDQGLLDYVDRVTTITTLERDKMPLV